jgi:hypothetical protein
MEQIRKGPKFYCQSDGLNRVPKTKMLLQALTKRKVILILEIAV